MTEAERLIEIMARARAEADWGEPIPDAGWERHAHKQRAYMAAALFAAEAAGYEIRKMPAEGSTPPSPFRGRSRDGA